MSLDKAEQLFNHFIAMQDSHMETLKGNIMSLKKDKPVITDLDLLTIQRNSLYSEVQAYFEKEFPQEDSKNADFRVKVEFLSEKLNFIMEREDKLKKMVEENSRLLSEKLSRLRKGKSALSAYNKAADNI